MQIRLIFHGVGRPGRDIPAEEAPYWLETAMFETILDRVAASPLRHEGQAYRQ